MDKESDKATYRIIDDNGKIYGAGTDIGSFFTLEKARELVDYSKGQRIYEWSVQHQRRVWEVF